MKLFSIRYHCRTLIPILILINTLLFAQEQKAALIITEVHLDSIQPGNTWIEIFNPAEDTLTLQRFRISHVKTINILPDFIQKKGGIAVAPKNYLILCAHMESFKSIFSDDVFLVEIPLLGKIGSGGFIAATSKDCEETLGGIVRYGVASMSAFIHEISEAQIINFSPGNESFKREVTKSTEGYTLSAFSTSTPNPGK